MPERDDDLERLVRESVRDQPEERDIAVHDGPQGHVDQRPLAQVVEPGGQLAAAVEGLGSNVDRVRRGDVAGHFQAGWRAIDPEHLEVVGGHALAVEAMLGGGPSDRPVGSSAQ